MDQRNSVASPKVVIAQIYYPCVLRVKPISHWYDFEPDERAGCGHDCYGIGEGLIPYPV
jgi:hypothetical protein